MALVFWGSIFCCSILFLLRMHVCFCCVCFSFFRSYAKRLAGKKVSEMTYFVLTQPIKLNSLDKRAVYCIKV